MAEQQDRLGAIIGRKRDSDAAARAASDAEKQRLADDAARKAAAQQQWNDVVFPHLLQVVKRINDRTSGDGILLKVEDSPGKPEAAIAQTLVKLFLDGRDTQKASVFNVNAFGKIVIVNQIPHTGRGSRDAQVSQADEAWIEAQLLDFLEQAIPQRI
jgi:hypothetical protein